MSDIPQLNVHRLQRELAVHRFPVRVVDYQVDGNLERLTLEPCTVKRSLMRHIAKNLGMFADASCRVTFKVVGRLTRVKFLVLRHE